MRVLDLYCGEGGAGFGYHLAGCEVVGVDFKPQPRYPFAFLQADVLSLDRRFLRWFDFIHASPPCQFGTALRHAKNAKSDHPNLIPPTRQMLQAAGKPYTIENVEAAAPHLVKPFILQGQMFGLHTRGHQNQRFVMQRRRAFEAPWLTAALPPVDTYPEDVVVGLYGGHLRVRAASAGGRRTRDLEDYDRPAMAQKLMEIPFGTMSGMSQAIPPAYSRWIAQQFQEQGAGHG